METDGDSDSKSRVEPEGIVRFILKEFPGVAADLEQLLQMIDGGQAVDISGLSQKSLVKHLKKLFQSLNLMENGNQVFLLPPNVCPTLEIVGPIIHSQTESRQQQSDYSVSPNNIHSAAPDEEHRQEADHNTAMPHPNETADAPRRRVIGPEMPSAELLAAAAKLTEAEAELREAEVEEDNEVFIGPPPPAVVTEAESANEAERFEEVTRILGAEVDSPYDILGVNRNMSSDHTKKRYWKLSLMVHPDKCPHPQAHQAFIKLNKAFKDLQDPEKRKALDEKIRVKEEQEEFKAELKAMREAAQWRRLQGISMEGDDVLLAEMDMKVGPKRDEWMTTLPPERKPGVTTQTTKFSRTSKDGRGDTSMWTDTPSEKAQKAKMNYLEAYNEAAALASKQQEKKETTSDAALVDEYNKKKRSKSLVEKHQETVRSSSKRKSNQERAKEEWEGQHPWKPWDREKDLTAGRQSVKLDPENMSQGLSSRFASGSFQRNFL
jgi:curved DNA-binding protein CbpA